MPGAFGLANLVIALIEGTLRRAFLQVTGLTPRQLAEALRVQRFKAMLRAGGKIKNELPSAKRGGLNF